jgi:hypothetical protein
MPEEPKADDVFKLRESLGVKLILGFAAGVLAVGEWFLVGSLTRVPSWDKVLTDHISAIAGLQVAAAVSFWLVLFLSQT